jgi:CubicO group peptidase (beta-lactamase class C family)
MKSGIDIMTIAEHSELGLKFSLNQSDYCLWHNFKWVVKGQFRSFTFEMNHFSLGFGITSEKSANLNFRNKGSFSWGGYYGTSYWADPKDKMVVLIMTQHNPNSHGELGGIIERIIYGSRVN